MQHALLWFTFLNIIFEAYSSQSLELFLMNMSQIWLNINANFFKH